MQTTEDAEMQDFNPDLVAKETVSELPNEARLNDLK
jgi:hypothetical protein